jgi:FkbM family methyltransferase
LIITIGLRPGARFRRITSYRSMPVLVSSDNPPEVSVFLWNSYEPETERVIEAVLEPGLTALDVGANCGVVTLAMRAAVGAGGRVISVDPSPFACRRVEQQLALNGFDNVEVVNVAVGAEQTVAEYLRGRVGLGALPPVDDAFTTGDRLVTSVTTVDELLSSCGVRQLALMKIDTDGSECSILEGSQTTLRHFRPVVTCELSPGGLRRRGRSPQDQADLLLDAGYELFRPSFRRSSPLLARSARLKHFEPLDLGELPEEQDYNILAVHCDDERRVHILEGLGKPARGVSETVSSLQERSN